VTSGHIDTQAIHKAVQASVKAWRAPGAAVAVVSGSDVFVQGCGVREVGKPDRVTPDTLFAIASVSKAFTTTAMAILVDEGKIGWDDPVRKHLPWFRLSDPTADSNVTLRDLLCHRTGMPRHDMLWYANDWSRQEIVRRYGFARNSTSFRSSYEYANIPFMAAGLVVEAVSGYTWEEFVEARILGPVGMESTRLRMREIEASPDHATPHELYKGRVTVAPRFDNDACCPAGGINTSARDISRWIRLLLGGGEIDGSRIVSTQSLRETWKPHTAIVVENPDRFGLDWGSSIMSYCLGRHTRGYRGHTVIGHSGGIDGFVAQISLIPKLGIGVAVMANLADGHLIKDLDCSLLDTVLGLPKIDWIAQSRALRRATRAEEKSKRNDRKRKAPRHTRTRPSRGLDAYVGSYSDPAYGALTITRDGRFLDLHYGRFGIRMKHYHYDTFEGS